LAFRLRIAIEIRRVALRLPGLRCFVGPASTAPPGVNIYTNVP